MCPIQCTTLEFCWQHNSMHKAGGFFFPVLLLLVERSLCPPLLPVEVEFLGYHGEKNFLRPHGRMRYLGKPYSWCKIEGFPSKVPLPPISPRGKSDLVFSCQGSHLLRQPAQCCSKIPARKPLQCRAEWGEGSGSRPLSRLHQTASCCDSVTYCTKLPQS